MSSIFIKPNEMKITEDLEKINFEQLLEQGIKLCHLEEKLELFLYDVADAIREQQTLLIQSSQNREIAYLIPTLLAYKHSVHFNRFIIVASSSQTQKKVIEKVKEISRILDVAIPIHVLKEPENYLCLRRLHGKTRKSEKNNFYSVLLNIRKNPEKFEKKDFPTLSEEDWEQIHVRSCEGIKCKSWRNCRYHLQRESIHQNGCIILSHLTFIQNQEESENTTQDTHLVILEDANDFIFNVKNSDILEMKYETIAKYFRSANRLLIEEGISLLPSEHDHLLKSFFQRIYTESFQKNKITPSIQRIAEELGKTAEILNIHFNRMILSKSYQGNLGHIADQLENIANFFMDMARGGSRYTFHINTQGHHPDTGGEYLQVVVTCFPVKARQREVAERTLRSIPCSLICTGENIAGENDDYYAFIKDTNLQFARKNIVKEFVYKK